MSMNLFIEPEVNFPHAEPGITKLAAETALPEDPNSWPQEVLQELYKQVPFISEFDPHVNMEKVDAERGYGMGAVEVMNQSEMQQDTPEDQMQAAGIRRVRIPIIIKDGKLQPFDLLIKDDSTIVPLTETRLRAALFRPQAFDVTSQTPGDQSMIGQLYPPYRQNYGFGGGGVAMNIGMGKQGSSELEQYLEKEAAVLDQGAREDIKSKNFAVKKKGGEEKYPIHDAAHARNALTRVRQFGSSSEKAQVFKAVSKKYPALATRSEVIPEKQQRKAEKKLGLGKGEESQKKEKALQKVGSVLKAILPTINPGDLHAFKQDLQDRGLQAQFTKNAAATHEALALLLNHEPLSLEKTAAALPAHIRPSVVQVVRVGGSYKVKTASHLFWQPYEEVINRGELVQRFGTKIALAADTSGAVTATDDGGVEEAAEPAEADTDMLQAGPIQEPGLYKVQDADGREMIGHVFTNLLDVDGTPMPLSLFTNGAVSSVQSDIIGVPAGEAHELPTSDTPSGFGTFVSPDGQATVPVEMGGSFTGPGEDELRTFQASTFDGRDVQISVQPNIQTLVSSPEGVMLVPEHWRWVPLEESGMVGLKSTEDDVDKEASAKRAYATVVVRAGGPDTFSFSGHALSKLARDETQFLGIDDAMFLLGGLGVKQSYGIRKLGEAVGLGQPRPVEIRVGRMLQPAGHVVKEARARAQEKLGGLPIFRRRRLVKEASVIPDPTAVDSVLSLGFLNPENLMTFVGYLPVIEDSQKKMSELLLSARLGMQDIPLSALERAIRSTEEVLEGLKIVAFQSQ